MTRDCSNMANTYPALSIYKSMKERQEIAKNMTRTMQYMLCFLAFSAPFPEIIGVLVEWGSLHIATADGKVFILSLRLEDTFSYLRESILTKSKLFCGSN